MHCRAERRERGDGQGDSSIAFPPAASPPRHRIDGDEAARFGVEIGAARERSTDAHAVAGADLRDARRGLVFGHVVRVEACGCDLGDPGARQRLDVIGGENPSLAQPRFARADRVGENRAESGGRGDGAELHDDSYTLPLREGRNLHFADFGKGLIAMHEG